MLNYSFGLLYVFSLHSLSKNEQAGNLNKCAYSVAFYLTMRYSFTSASLIQKSDFDDFFASRPRYIHDSKSQPIIYTVTYRNCGLCYKEKYVL